MWWSVNRTEAVLSVQGVYFGTGREQGCDLREGCR